MVYFMEHPLKVHDLEVPLFEETPSPCSRLHRLQSSAPRKERLRMPQIGLLRGFLDMAKVPFENHTAWPNLWLFHQIEFDSICLRTWVSEVLEKLSI